MKMCPLIAMIFLFASCSKDKANKLGEGDSSSVPQAAIPKEDLSSEISERAEKSFASQYCIPKIVPPVCSCEGSPSLNERGCKKNLFDREAVFPCLH